MRANDPVLDHGWPVNNLQLILLRIVREEATDPTPCALGHGACVSRQCSPAGRDGNHSDVQTGHLLQCRDQPHHIVDVPLALRALPPFVKIQFPGN